MKTSNIASLNIFRSPVAAMSGIVALSLALGLGAWMTKYYQALYGSLDNTAPGIDYVLGPKSSGLSVLLDSMFYAGNNPDIIDYLVIETMRAELGLRLIIPLANFASYKGLPVLGTDESFFNRPPDLSPPKMASGRWFQPRTAQAVVGSEASRRSGLRVGDKFTADYASDLGNTVQLEVVGVLARSGLPHDRGIYVAMEQAWACQNIAIRKGMIRMVKEYKGVNSILVSLDPEQPDQPQRLHDMIHTNSTPHLVEVEAEIDQLREILGQGGRGLWGISGLLTLLAMTATMLLFTERGEIIKRDLGLFRALGYSRFHIARILLWESLYIAAAGIFLGLILERLLTGLTRLLWNPPWLTLPSLFTPSTLLLCSAIVLATLLSTLFVLWHLYRWNVHDALKGL